MRLLERLKSAFHSSRSQEDRLAAHLVAQPAGKLEDPLETYQRFDLAGHDYKGQLSCGFAQSGFGLSLSVSVDVGTLFAPGLVHVPFALSGSMDRSNHTELVLVRFPRQVWQHRFTSVGQMRQGGDRALWTTHRPLVLQTLRGIRWAGDISAEAGITAGIGDPLGDPDAKDGVGVAIAVGAQAAGSVSRWGSKLVDPEPRRFRSAYPADEGTDEPDGSDRLATYLNMELEGDVKRRITAWIAQKAGQDDAALSVRVGHGLWDAPHWVIQNWEEWFLGASQWPFDPFSSFKRLWDIVRTNPTTAQVDAALVALDQELETKEHDTSVTGHDRTVVLADRATVARLRVILESRKADKDAGIVREHLAAKTTATASAQARIAAKGTLDITSTSLESKVTGGVQLRAVAGVSARAQAKIAVKHISVRFQAVSRRSDDSEHALVFTQDTVLQQHVYGLAGSTTSFKSKQNVKAKLFGTITYRSGCAYWRDSSLGTIVAQPNGSGVSFGMSIEAERLDSYALKCKSGADLSDADTTLENLLAGQLRVDTPVLRAFVKAYPLVGAISVDNQLEDTSVLVESAFGIVHPQQMKTMTTDARHTIRQPESLLDTGWAKERLGTASGGAARSPRRTELSALRVRYRIRRVSDNSGPLVTIGWAFSNDKEATPKNAVAAPSEPSPSRRRGITRVDRAGNEAIVDLHTFFYPDPQPEDSDRSPDAYELAVPGVALFGQ